MLNKIFKNNQPFILFDFIFWLVLAVIFPAISGNFSLGNILNIFLYLSAVYYLGEVLLGKIDAVRQIPFLFKSGIYIVFGGIACGMVFLFLPNAIILYGLFCLLLFDLWFNKRVDVSFSFKNFLCLLPFFVILFQTYELAYATNERYSHSDGDYFYFTAIVESIKANHSINDAIYHSGLPINYLVVPFLAPGQLAEFSGISSQFALWGIFGKIIPVICLGTISYTIVKLHEILFIPLVNKSSFARKQLFAGIMLIFLGPLHFLNMFKGDFKNSLFLGEGYLLPLGSPGFALAMLFTGMVLLLVFSKPKYSIPDGVALVVFLCIITASKIALFLPLGALLGVLSVMWLFKKQKHLFFTLLLALPFCIFIYKFLIAGSDSIAVVELTKNGYYPSYFGALADKYGISGSAWKKLLIMMGISVFMWLSVKLLILAASGISLLKNNFKAVTLIAAGMVGFVISLLPGFFIDVYGRDGSGKYLYDGKFDMAQFTRAGIFLLTIITIVFCLYLVYEHKKYFIRKASLIMICCSMLAVLYSFFANDFKKPEPTDQSWYIEVREDFLKQKPGMMALLGNGNHSGQTLTTAGVYPWFCTGIREDGEGYVNSLSGYNRNKLFQRFLDSTVSLPDRKLAADSIKMKGVDCIVASPTSLARIQLAQKDSLISLISGTKWFYKPN